MPDQRLTYSPQEVAVLLGLHLNTIRKHVKNGKIPSKKLGHRILIPAQALEKWLQSESPAEQGGVR